ncbi:MAG: outer membrane protein assembly factor BamB family protein [Jatrophihabitans sp.]|uniref:outer membrane protein assembly factor BamB family protein n=1 Tax=Jatrophihabitans sp. TaxID=1932789 RepID=UPI003F7F6289
MLPTVGADEGSGPAPERPATATAATGPAVALAAHRARLRRLRVVYASVLVVLAVVGTVVVARVWVTGEVHNSRLRAVATAPAPVASAAPTPTLVKAWDTTDTAAIGAPLSGGTVVTFDDHTVRGRDARTGAQTWSYYRSNRAVCTAAQANGVTMAIYRVNGNCDELTALDSGTGKRRWTRTLDMDGHPVNGTPTVSATPYTLLVATSDVIYAIDPGSGYDRWEFHQAGCRIQRAVVGSSGALISQVCDAPQCDGDRFCGAGPQLLLRDAYTGRDDKNSAINKDGKNPDQIHWNKLGDTDIPVSADGVIAAINRTTRALDQLDNQTGNPTVQVRLRPTPSQLTGIVAVPTTAVELIWIHGITYAVGTGATDAAWTLASSGPPTVVGTTPTEWPAVADTARVTMTAPGGAVLTVSASTGKVTTRSQGAATAPGGTAVPVGSGFLVQNDGGSVVYR